MKIAPKKATANSGFSLNDIGHYLENCLNTALKLDGETSYTNSFQVKVGEHGFMFVPLMPATFKMSADVYDEIYSLASGALYPFYTLLKQSGPYYVKTGEDLNNARGFFFPWLKGVPERLVIDNLETFIKNDSSDKILIMNNLSFSLNKVHHIAIAGQSGSGKSYALTYLMTCFKHVADLQVVDPKYDSPARFCARNKVPCISPSRDNSNTDFLNSVNEMLAESVNLILDRQAILFRKPKQNFKHKVIVIDELLALTTSGNKRLVDTFFSLLTQIALLGRATHVHLLLVSQRFDAKAIPTACRAQLTMTVQLGVINKETTQFLFPDLDPKGIVTPTGYGSGLIRIVDNDHPDNTLPVVFPTVKDWGWNHA